jgi:putative transposon-encoded protein
MENNTNELSLPQHTNAFAFPIGNEAKTSVPKLDLGRRIEITFLSMGYRNLRDVQCKCKDGRAVLTGRTKTFYEKQVAQVIAAKVAGVTAVENLIEVDQ